MTFSKEISTNLPAGFHTMVSSAQGGWTTQIANLLRSLARSRLRGPRSFALAPGAPVLQASGLLLVLLDQDYQANTPPCAHAPTI